MFKNLVALSALAMVAAAYDEDAFTSSAALGSIDYSASVAPEEVEAAASAFDFGAEFISQNDYEASIDLTADILIAIEALGAEINEISSRTDTLTALVDSVADEELLTEQEFDDFEARVQEQADSTHDLQHRIGEIEKEHNFQHDQLDNIFALLKHYCHQFTHVSTLPTVCQPILVEAADKIPYQFAPFTEL